MHLVTSHILTLNPEGRYKRPFPKSLCQQQRTPAEPVSHLIDAHDLRLTGGSGKQKKAFNGDFGTLKLGAFRKKLEAGGFPIKPANDTTSTAPSAPSTATATSSNTPQQVGSSPKPVGSAKQLSRSIGRNSGGGG